MKVILLKPWQANKTGSEIDVNGAIAKALIEAGIAEQPKEKKKVVEPVKEKSEGSPVAPKKKK